MQMNPYEPPNPKSRGMPSASLIDDQSIRYSVDFEDIMEFQKFHLAHSPTMRNQLFGLMGFTALFTGAACVLSLSALAFPLRLAIATLVAVVSALASRAFLKWSVANQSRKLLREGSNDGILGDHELRIDEKTLTEITSVNETRHAFSGIARIEETDDYAFIYISTLQAHAIPKKKIQSGNVVGFMERIRAMVPKDKYRTKP